jgi:hypothetical protein
MHDLGCLVQIEQASEKRWMMTGSHDQVCVDIAGQGPRLGPLALRLD